MSCVCYFSLFFFFFFIFIFFFFFFFQAEDGIRDGTVTGVQTCALQICEFSPMLNQSSVTVEGSPFPITLTMNSPVVLKMDFNVDASVQQSDLSITPTVSVVQIPTISSTGQPAEEDVEVIGTITTIDQTAHTFKVQS